MVRFAEWLVIDSFVDRLEREVLLEQAALETLDMVVSVLRENEEDDDSPAVLADPFTGSEDAEPVKGSEVQDDPDAEPATPQESGRIDPTSNEKKILRKISSALKTIRAGGIRDRFRKVEELKKIRKELEDTNDDEDILSAQTPQDPQDALPILVSLGYLSKGVAEKISYRLGRRLSDDMKQKLGGFLTSKAKDSIKKQRSKASDKLMEKIVAASQEEGNDPPEGGFPTDSDTKKANDDFVGALNRLLGGRFRSLARSNQTNMGKDQTGHRLTEPDELAANMAVGLLGHFAKRKWRGGELLPWNSDYELLRRDSGWLLPYLMTTAKNLPKKMAQTMRSQLAPPPKTKSSVANKGKKAEIINSDFKSGNLGFYIDYMKEAAKNPFSRRSPGEQIIQPREKGDKIRLAIMQDIEEVVNFTSMSDTDISMDPSGDDETLRRRVRTMLSTYLYRVLPTNSNRVVHASILAQNSDGEESSMDDLLSAHADAGDDEPDFNDHQGIDAMSGSSSDEDRTAPLLGLLRKAIDEISATGPNGPTLAFALCVKFNLKCDVRTKPGRMKDGKPTTSVASVSVSEDAELNIPRDFDYKTIGTNCTNALGMIGLNNTAIAQRWGLIPGAPGRSSGLTPISQQLVHEYMKGNPRDGAIGALTMLCNKLKAMVGRVPPDQD